jgi:hypothetical protein
LFVELISELSEILMRLKIMIREFEAVLLGSMLHAEINKTT